MSKGIIGRFIIFWKQFSTLMIIVDFFFFCFV